MRANNKALTGRTATIIQAGGSHIYFDHPFLRTQISSNVCSSFGIEVTSLLKLEDEFFRAEPVGDFSKMEHTVDGSSVIITNTITSGRITLRVLQGKGSVAEADFIECAKLIQATGDSYGGRITTVKMVNGKVLTSVYKDVVFQNFPFEVINGNAVAEYPCTMLFGDYVSGIITPSSSTSDVQILASGNDVLYNLVDQMASDRDDIRDGVSDVLKNALSSGSADAEVYKSTKTGSTGLAGAVSVASTSDGSARSISTATKDSTPTQYSPGYGTSS